MKSMQRYQGIGKKAAYAAAMVLTAITLNAGLGFPFGTSAATVTPVVGTVSPTATQTSTPMTLTATSTPEPVYRTTTVTGKYSSERSLPNKAGKQYMLVVETVEDGKRKSVYFYGEKDSTIAAANSLRIGDSISYAPLDDNIGIISSINVVKPSDGTELPLGKRLRIDSYNPELLKDVVDFSDLEGSAAFTADFKVSEDEPLERYLIVIKGLSQEDLRKIRENVEKNSQGYLQIRDYRADNEGLAYKGGVGSRISVKKTFRGDIIIVPEKEVALHFTTQVDIDQNPDRLVEELFGIPTPNPQKAKSSTTQKPTHPTKTPVTAVPSADKPMECPSPTATPLTTTTTQTPSQCSCPSPTQTTVVATATSVPATQRPTASTQTPRAATQTPIVVTATPAATMTHTPDPTQTPIVITATPVPATATPVPATQTPIVVTATPAATMTHTPVPATATPTPTETPRPEREEEGREERREERREDRSYLDFSPFAFLAATYKMRRDSYL